MAGHISNQRKHQDTIPATDHTNISHCTNHRHKGVGHVPKYKTKNTATGITQNPVWTLMLSNLAHYPQEFHMHLNFKGHFNHFKGILPIKCQSIAKVPLT